MGMARDEATVDRILLFQMSGWPGTRPLWTGSYCFRRQDGQGRGHIGQDIIVSDVRMARDEATVDRIFAGNLDNLPPLSSKVTLLSTDI